MPQYGMMNALKDMTKSVEASGVSWRGAAYLFPLLIAGNLAAWLYAWRAFGDQPALMGTALLAWIFGLRHAVDADHIAAIDNVVRKLMRDGQRPYATGLFFSLGHSAVVVPASAAIALASAATGESLAGFKDSAGAIGGFVSAGFLLLIAVLNLSILRGIWRDFRRAARGETLDAEDHDALSGGGGWLARLCRPLFRTIARPWHMLPLGFLFGLGFDTATEVALLGIAATQTAQGLEPFQIMIFPALFAAGMTLVDTADSALMTEAYGWALTQPIRKLWYNLTMTAISVAIALLIGGLEVLGLVAEQFELTGGAWQVIAGLNENLTIFGAAMVALFVLAWAGSAAFYHWKGYDRLAPEQLAGGRG